MAEALHFTGNEEADALLAQEPLALLIGFALDQQVTVPTAFVGPLKLKQRLGTLEARTIAQADPGSLEAIFREKPAIHRFPGSMARRVQELAAVIDDEYGGRAERVWNDATDGDDLRRRISALPGFGQMKVTSLGAVLTRETGGTAVGRRIREILHDTAVTDLADRAEALLTAADRAQHSEVVIRPALAAGRHVVSDRSVYSTLAYQGFGRMLPLDEVRHINEWALAGCWPDLVLLLDVEPEVLERRMRGRQLDRFERETPEFHARVRDGFCQMAAEDPTRWVVVDGAAHPDRVASVVRAAVRERLGI